ncbi:hypothetical protein HanRHA438_Chr05g0229901 [Helianthus annuus]|nr:hypothetical protein HanRHA438_Chr05g0229901 [Helianthus annuus]
MADEKSLFKSVFKIRFLPNLPLYGFTSPRPLPPLISQAHTSTKLIISNDAINPPNLKFIFTSSLPF